jgi:hypothetical protein
MKAKLLLGGLIAYFLFCLGIVALIATLRGAEAEGPTQPIAFSHPLHVTRVGLDCRHCHAAVDRSRHPGIPSIQVCMECHAQAVQDRPEVQKLIAHWEEKRPIAWNRVHRLPDHVHFTHKRHVRAGVECVTCHSEVEHQPRIRQTRSLDMGWCVSCHREREASTDCWTCHR